MCGNHRVMRGIGGGLISRPVSELGTIAHLPLINRWVALPYPIYKRIVIHMDEAIPQRPATKRVPK